MKDVNLEVGGEGKVSLGQREGVGRDVNRLEHSYDGRIRKGFSSEVFLCFQGFSNSSLLIRQFSRKMK